MWCYESVHLSLLMAFTRLRHWSLFPYSLLLPCLPADLLSFTPGLISLYRYSCRSYILIHWWVQCLLCRSVFIRFFDDFSFGFIIVFPTSLSWFLRLKRHVPLVLERQLEYRQCLAPKAFYTQRNHPKVFIPRILLERSKAPQSDHIRILTGGIRRRRRAKTEGMLGNVGIQIQW